MDDNERNSPIQSVQPVRKIRAQIFKRERRELMYLYERARQGQASKRKKPSIRQTELLTSDASTPAEIEQDFLDYKTDLKNRLTFDRAQLLSEDLSSD
ncbi:hypothetical protein E4K67_11250 [Desulfosporosinus fructosivorans]|uniref:Uncharacterized protein n=1 Tax=Desulfosporosinus fructosivorans TaxID=2018669 RepID=A0A4Z0R8B7_9FIRM|nr:hypothetical protein [Desulfosporosinus fructosivorans]TGE38499.1 hypothetical protein E4K67_11250 [Desulfosporosinus fructosivorans]